MRIACPACNAAYQVPDEQLREGRVVRCARCGTDWAPIEAIPVTDEEPEREPPPPVETPAHDPEPFVEPRTMAIEEQIPLPIPMTLPPARRKRRGSVALVLAWMLSLAVVGGAIAALGIERDRIMSAWPPSIRGYAALGLAAKHSEP
jgi:predicted Zn finger-like uncharacterized protein